MAIRDLIPWSGGREVSVRRSEDSNPFLALHRQMNRLFDDAFHGSISLPSRMIDGLIAPPPGPPSKLVKLIRT